MAESARLGTLWLTLAQAWHAASGYVVFIVAARVLGREGFGDFGLVAWTMTALETLVVAGAPRAVSYHVARQPEAAAQIVRRGAVVTGLVAALLALLLFAAAPLLRELSDSSQVVTATRIAALDFVAFAGFAVLVQAVNGLRRFARQASIWAIYSTCKVVLVVGLLHSGRGISAGIAGYVIASAAGSLAAVLGGLPLLRGSRPAAHAPGHAELFRFALPMAMQATALMLMLTVDIWAARWSSASAADEGGYVAASTLARVLFFVFVAFADALLPTVARQWASGSPAQARSTARELLGLLLCLLLPVCGIATGASAQALDLLYGGDGGDFAAASPYLDLLAPAAALVTIAAVLAALVAAAERAAASARLLVSMVFVGGGICFAAAAALGPYGAAVGALVAAALAAALLGFQASLVLGAGILPVRAAAAAGAVGVALHAALRFHAPPGWWLVPYAGALLLAGVGVLVAIRALPMRIARASRA